MCSCPFSFLLFNVLLKGLRHELDEVLGSGRRQRDSDHTPVALCCEGPAGEGRYNGKTFVAFAPQLVGEPAENRHYQAHTFQAPVFKLELDTLVNCQNKMDIRPLCRQPSLQAPHDFIHQRIDVYECVLLEEGNQRLITGSIGVFLCCKQHPQEEGGLDGRWIPIPKQNLLEVVGDVEMAMGCHNSPTHTSSPCFGCTEQSMRLPIT
mmetsp:Transcript_3484/g.4811  ORF Transcript_3484/g.4811 Transcript_3484/m.4811 type:complete len:207 (-) Transcript_3484:19-639(-)